MWVWLTAESWQDCSIIFSDDLQLQNQFITLVADEEQGTWSNSIPGGWLWTTQDHKNKVVCGGDRRATMQRADALTCWPDLSPGDLHSWLPWEVTSASSSVVILQLFHKGTNNIDRAHLGVAKMCVKGSVDSAQQHTHHVWLLPVRRKGIRKAQPTLWLKNSLISWCLSRASGSTTMRLS